MKTFKLLVALFAAVEYNVVSTETINIVDWAAYKEAVKMTAKVVEESDNFISYEADGYKYIAEVV